MTDFFTPIEVSQEKQTIEDQYQVQKYNNDPFMPALSKQESFGDHRKKIIKWLKNMSISARVSKLTFTNKQFACLLLSMFERIEQVDRSCLIQFGISLVPQQGFKISEQKFNRDPDFKLVQAENKLIQSVIIANRYSRFDSFTFDSKIVSDVSSLFQLFDVIQNGISYQLTPSNYQNYCNQSSSSIIFFNPSDYDSSMTKTLGSWIVQVIKKHLSIQYFKQFPQNEQKQKLFANNNQKQIKKQLKSDPFQLFKIKSKIFKKYWNSLNQQNRHIFLRKAMSRDVRSVLSQYRQTIKISNDSFPKVKCCYPEEIQQFVEKMVLADGEIFYHELTFTNLQLSTYEIGLFKYEIMIDFEIEIQKFRREQVLSMRKKFTKLIKNKKQRRRSSIECQKNKINSQKDKHLKKQQQMLLNNKNQNKTNETLQQQTNPKSCEQKQKKKPVNSVNNNTLMCNKVNKKKRKKQNIIELKKSQNCSSSKQKSQTTNDQDEKQIELQNEGKNCHQGQIYMRYNLQNEMQMNRSQNIVTSSQKNVKKQIAQAEFNNVLKEFQQRNTKWSKYQQVAINRIASILYNYNLSYHVFGSYANGLTIPSSDIDICIDPTIIHYFYASFCTYKEKVILALKFLQSCFEQMSCCSNFKIITTASVPLLAFEIDLGVGFGDPKNLHYNISKLKKSPKVYVDLTIQPFVNMQKQFSMHLGYQSTALVREWLMQYRQLGPLVRILKHILNKQNLNKSFTGGISSYALTSLVYSFLKSQIHRKQQALLSLFIQFCQFIHNLNEKEVKIQPWSPSPIQHHKTDKITIENYFNGKNLTDNCFRFNQIKSLFQKVRQKIGTYNQNLKQKEYTKNLRSLLLQ